MSSKIIWGCRLWCVEHSKALFKQWKWSMNHKLSFRILLFAMFPVVSSFLKLCNICLLVLFSPYIIVFLTNTFLADKSACKEKGGDKATCGWLTDELVLHSLQQCLVGIFRLHGSRTFPCQHGANQMLSAAWQKTHRHSWTCNVNFINSSSQSHKVCSELTLRDVIHVVQTTYGQEPKAHKKWLLKY